MMLAMWNGVGSLILRCVVRDSTLTNNGGKTGLTFSSSGLIVATIADNEAAATAYTQAGSTIETVTTLGTFATPTATKCRFKEVDATNLPGVYEVQIANARWGVSGARYVIVTISGVSGATQENYLVQLPTVNVSDGTNSATPAVPNAAAGANGGLPVLSSGGTTLNYTVTTLTTYTGNTVQTGDAYARLGAPAGGSISADVASVKSSVGTPQQAGSAVTLPSIPSNWITAAGIASGAFAVAVWDGAVSGHTTTGTFGGALNAAGSAGDPWATPIPGAYSAGTAGHRLGNVPDVPFPPNFPALGITSGGKISEVVLADTVTTYTGNTPQTGDAYARVGAAGVGLTAVGLAAAGLDAVAVEAGLNARQAISVIAAGVAGGLSGAGTTTVTIKGAGVATTRIVATVDNSQGNRTAVVLTPPA